MSHRIPLRPSAAGLLAGALVMGGLAFAPAASAAPSSDVVINEVYGGGGNSGATLKNDFIELYNGGSAAVDLSGWSVQYASAGGNTWAVTVLTGSIAPGGFYLVQEAKGSGGSVDLPAPDATGTIPMSGTSGRVALVQSSTALACGLACAETSAVLDFVGYGGAGDFEGTKPADTLSNTTSDSRTGGVDTDDNAADFVKGEPTSQNSGGSAPQRHCGTGTIPIGEVQGDGATTPCGGETVTVEGTVVGDVQDGFDGFFVQDAADDDPHTSNGIFVYAPDAPDVQLGTLVRVTGLAKEFDGLTELDADAVEVTGHGELPAATTLPLPSDDAAREALEGMYVQPPTGLTVAEVYNLDKYGEIELAEGGQLITPTEAAEPGDDAAAVADKNARRSLLLDDGRSTDLSKAKEAPPYLTIDDPVRVGDTAVLEPVVLSYGHSAWRLQPVDGTAEGTTFTPTNPRPATPGPVGGGDLRIADFNVLNYFVDFPSEFGDDARGATNPAELAQQQTKIVDALVRLDADIITLHEIENSAVLTPATPYRAVETLVAALNKAQGPDTWRFVRAHEASDVITNAIIYRTNAAHPVGDPQKPAEDSVWDNAREPIAQTFRSRGEVFTVIANHLKSKGSSCGKASDDPQQGNCNGDRVAQAQALVAFAHQVAEAAGDPDVLLMGDFNSYRHEDPVHAIEAAGYTDYRTDGEYSYVFQGGSGSLDHVFASPTMLPKLTGHTIWDINAVEPFAYEYDASYEGLYAPYPYRASDHNPTLIGVDTKYGTPAAGTPRR